jgi:hypothetical protein
VITLDSIRAAVLAPNPYTEMDRLVRAEMGAGRKVKEIFDSISPLVDEALEIEGLTEDGEEAFLGTLDALTGNCHRDCQYKDPPNTTLPTKAEVAKLPHLARVAFAARCARRVLSLLQNGTHQPQHYYIDPALAATELAEQTAMGWEIAPHHLMEIVDSLNGFVGDMELSSVVTAAKVAAVAAAGNSKDAELAAKFAIGAFPARDLSTSFRRDFDHLARLTEWQHWTDDTPVPPEVFGPLWPEGPPKGWPADPDTPQRTDLPLELLSRARVLERMTEDEAVNLFNAINAYYIARTGDRLTLEDLRPFIAAGVLAGV